MKKILTLTLAAVSAIGLSAQVPLGGKKISNELIGIFFEDISSAADGGLCAERLQNGAFEYSPIEKDGWGAGTAWKFARPGHSLGYMEQRQQDPVHPNNRNYMHVVAEHIGHHGSPTDLTGIGLQNTGFDGIPVKKGESFDFSAFFRNTDGKEKDIRIVLAKPAKDWLSSPIAIGEISFKISGGKWKKYASPITATEDFQNASLYILCQQEGEFDIDVVSLYPQDTYKGHGMRKDLAQVLADLHPKFMRFPGGCVVHGAEGFWNTYRWKNTVGPKEQRKPLKNNWGYHQSMSIGYYEYFQFCEDLGMEPLPILPCGVSCQGANGGWWLKGQNQQVCDMSEMDEWTQDALDLIEWANGDKNTKWGKVRAEAGHPNPFHLKFLGIGNEERISPEFEERFKYMYDRITAKYPDIVIVGTAGPGSHKGNSDYDNAWIFADKIGLPIIDEHYYEPKEYFLTSRQYDSYPRDCKTKVYLGEYASKDKKLIDALAEGLYLLHVERNADVVTMTSYAPLFARKGATNWNPDLIYFDNEKPYLTCSYYVQQMFGLSSGDYYYGDCVTFNRQDDNLLGQSVIYDSKYKKLFVKICNAGAETAQADINLSRFKIKGNVEKTVISGNPEDENNYDAQPIVPVKETSPAKKKMKVDVQPYSITMWSFQVK